MNTNKIETIKNLSESQILIIDDNKHARVILKLILEAAGVELVCCAADGHIGLEILNSVAIDAVFVDCEMPVLGGLDFILRTRAKGGVFETLPIIMVTAHADSNRVTRARDYGVTDILAKPFTTEAILGRLHAAISRPRPRIVANSYKGPDRRTNAEKNYSGPWRRADDRARIQCID